MEPCKWVNKKIPKDHNPCIEITFKAGCGLSDEEREKIIYVIIEEIQDRYMYVTEAKVDEKTVFKFDDSKFINIHKE